MIIISVRGTSGSGKTHLAKRVMDLDFCSRFPIEEPGQRQEVGYLCGEHLRVLGRYNVASGDADRITPRQLAFDLIERWATKGDVFYEGLLIANEVTRTVVLHRTHPTHVVFLDTPLDQSLAAINARRALRGVTEPVSRKKTEEKHAELGRVRQRLRQAGVPTYHLDREAAFLKVRELLQV